VDLRAGKVTLKHGDIPNLDMPPMTMVFQVQDPALLDQLKPGDKIRFRADKLSGSYTVIELQRDAAHTPTN
jgi:Cu/Ag efflux protein CusF